MSDSWADETTARIAAEIKRLRGERSGQWLSDRTAELGHRVSRSTISEIETGRRKSITVTDLVLLAAALSTAPVALLYPGPYDEVTDVLPGVPVRQLRAATWFSGLVTGLQNVAGQLDVDYPGNMYLLHTARQIDELRDEARRTLNHAADVAEDNPDQATALRAHATDQLRRVDELVDELAARAARG
jgi:transcriptional regulator with XRE-family HTH domain